MLLSILILVFVATAALIHGIVVRAPKALVPGVRLGHLSVNGRGIGRVTALLALPVVAVVARRVRRMPLTLLRPSCATLLRRSGRQEALSIDELLAACLLLAAAAPAWLLVQGSGVMTAFVGAVVAGGAPIVFLHRARRNRAASIVRALPGAVDVMSLSVQAGLDFLGAVRRSVERGRPGPLRDELATLLQDIRLGQTRRQALKSLADRLEIGEIAEFTSVLIQADLLGASIADTLHGQASRMRAERFQRAEREGAKAVQMLRGPLIAFIFPAVLLLIIAIAFGPAINTVLLSQVP